MSEAVDIRVLRRGLSRPRALAYLELAKLRLSSLVLAAVAVGFFLVPAARAATDTLALLTWTLIGVSLAVVGSHSLNQVVEAEKDALMGRTRHRPIPSGRLSRIEVLLFGLATGAAGVALLAWLVDGRAAAATAATLVTYVLVYTPLKRSTPLCVVAGAVAGALPPVIGWLAAGGMLGLEAAVLFGVVFFWQFPHFAAIAWLYREDYRRAAYPMLPVIDRRGLRTALHIVGHSLALLAVSLVPTVAGVAGVVYGAGAAVLGLVFLGFGIHFLREKSDRRARLHLLSSLVYLPLLFLLMLLDWA